MRNILSQSLCSSSIFSNCQFLSNFSKIYFPLKFQMRTLYSGLGLSMWQKKTPKEIRLLERNLKKKNFYFMPSKEFWKEIEKNFMKSSFLFEFSSIFFGKISQKKNIEKIFGIFFLILIFWEALKCWKMMLNFWKKKFYWEFFFN